MSAPGQDRSAVVAVYESLEQAAAVVPDLLASGVPLASISIAAREDPLDARDRPPGGRGPRTERLAGSVQTDPAFPTATVEVPRVGTVAIGGWLAQRAHDKMAEVGDPLAHLVFAGVPNQRIDDHRADLADDRCMVIVHGTWEEISVAARALNETETEHLAAYGPEG